MVSLGAGAVLFLGALGHFLRGARLTPGWCHSLIAHKLGLEPQSNAGLRRENGTKRHQLNDPRSSCLLSHLTNSPLLVFLLAIATACISFLSFSFSIVHKLFFAHIDSIPITTSPLALMAEKYSELEVAPHEHTEALPEVVDQAAHAPERDLSGDSPELDNKAWPLQVRMRCPKTCAHTLHKIHPSNKLTCRTSPLPPKLLPTHPRDPTSRRESATLPQNMAPLIQRTMRVKTGRH